MVMCMEYLPTLTSKTSLFTDIDLKNIIITITKQHGNKVYGGG